jgi:hypothetical protein
VIDKALDFLCRQVNQYLLLKLDPAPETAILLFNVSQLGSDTDAADDTKNAFLTLVNIEEDRISKSQENYVRKNDRIVFQQPKVHLNLYLLFSANLDYTESLKRISLIIQFFQHRSVFTPLTSPSLPAGIDELILDLYTANFQDLNNLWGVMGSRYLPSVMYKMRLITISEDLEQGDAGLVTQIVIKEQKMES